MPNRAAGLSPWATRLRAAQRSDSSMEARACVLRRRVGRALVEDHDDVRAQGPLHRHGLLRPQEDRAAIDGGPELDPRFGDSAHGPQTEDLEAAGVGQDRPRPVHEAVQPPQVPDGLGAGAQHQVKGIAQDDLGTEPLQLLRGHGLDGPVGPHRHEGRRLHLPAGKGQAPAPGRAVRRQQVKAHGSGPRATGRTRPDRPPRPGAAPGPQARSGQSG